MQRTSSLLRLGLARLSISEILDLARSNPNFSAPLRSLSTSSHLLSSYSPRSSDPRGSSSSSPSSTSSRGPHPGRQPRINPEDAKGSTNASIPFRQVHLAGAPSSTSTSSSSPPSGLSELQPLRAILSSIDTATHTVICVSVSPPIVRILDNAVEKEKARHAEARLKLTRKAASEDKEVQVSWGSAEGDLRHKAALARGILEKGDRATIIFAAKSGGAGISFSGPGGGADGGAGAGAGASGGSIKRDHKERVIQVFEQALGEVGVKWTDDEVRKGALVQRWQPEKKVRAERRQKVQNEEVEKKRDKEEKKEARRKKEEERRRRAEEKQREAAEALKVEHEPRTGRRGTHLVRAENTEDERRKGAEEMHWEAVEALRSERGGRVISSYRTVYATRQPCFCLFITQHSQDTVLAHKDRMECRVSLSDPDNSSSELRLRLLLGWRGETQGKIRETLKEAARDLFVNTKVVEQKLSATTMTSIQGIQEELHRASINHSGSLLPTRLLIEKAVHSQFPECSITFDSTVPATMVQGYPRAPWHHASTVPRTADLPIRDREKCIQAGEYTWAQGSQDETKIVRTVLAEPGPEICWNIPFTGVWDQSASEDSSDGL